MTYTQLTQEQRYQIYALLKTEQSQTKIATVIGVHKSTISRELIRNRGKRGYRPKQAHCFSQKRRRNSVTKRITAETWARIDEKLQQDWSPEQVSGWLKKNKDVEVSHEWIYQYIYRGRQFKLGPIPSQSCALLKGERDKNTPFSNHLRDYEPPDMAFKRCLYVLSKGESWNNWGLRLALLMQKSANFGSSRRLLHRDCGWASRSAFPLKSNTRFSIFTIVCLNHTVAIGFT